MSDDTAPIADIEDIELELAPQGADEVESAPTLRLEGLTKRYGSTIALDDFSYTPQLGSIHAILGDHQAGKSTLLRLLAGFSQPDEGVIRWFGRPVTLAAPADALALGMGMVHQSPTLIPSLSVGENILLGTADDGFPSFRRTPYRKIRTLAESYGLNINPNATVATLSSTEALHAELLRLLYRHVDILLLDDPFARLHPHTHEAFRATLRRLVEEGKTIFITTTNPATALQSADFIVLLQAGKWLRTFTPQESSPPMLYHAMTGYSKPPIVERPPATLGAVVLSTRHLAAPPTLRDATLDVRRGELLAVVGLPDNGQEHLAAIVAGNTPFTNGQLFLGSEELYRTTPEDALRLGVAYLPPMSDNQTLAETMSVAENLALPFYRHLAQGGMLFGNTLNSHAREVLNAHALKIPPNSPVCDLSPTDKHRLRLARATAHEYQLLVALYPTRGIPLEEALTIRRILLAERARGKAILLLTDNPQEAQNLADRIAVIQQGRIIATFDHANPALATLATLIEGTDSPPAP